MVDSIHSLLRAFDNQGARPSLRCTFLAAVAWTSIVPLMRYIVLVTLLLTIPLSVFSVGSSFPGRLGSFAYRGPIRVIFLTIPAFFLAPLLHGSKGCLVGLGALWWCLT